MCEERLVALVAAPAIEEAAMQVGAEKKL